MQEYIRILDEKEYTFDSLEQKCNALAEEGGWTVVMISDGYTNRTATLTRERSVKHLRNATIEAEIAKLSPTASITRKKKTV